MSATPLRSLHVPGRPVVLPNVWDAVSATVFAEAGFVALATSSSAVAATLGYGDGELTPPDEMFAAVARICRAAGVPVTADVEAGYGLPAAELVDRLLSAGAAGCNLEDSDAATGALRDPSWQADRLAAVRAAAGDALVLNARVDTFLTGRAAQLTAAERVADAVQRAEAYLEAGADCVYPILAPPDALATFIHAVDSPVNALYLPDGPSVDDLAALGVARVTFGGGLHRQATNHLRELANAVHQQANRLRH